MRKEAVWSLNNVTVQIVPPWFEIDAYTAEKFGFLALQWQAAFISILFHNTVDLKI